MLLNQGACGVKSRIAERPFYGFCVIPEWGVLGLDYVYSMFFGDFFRNEKIHMHYQTKPGKQLRLLSFSSELLKSWFCPILSSLQVQVQVKVRYLNISVYQSIISPLTIPKFNSRK